MFFNDSRTRREAEMRLWERERRGRGQRLACELQGNGADGYEVLFLRDWRPAELDRQGKLLHRRQRFATRRAALAHADAVRTYLERHGWTEPEVSDR